MDLRASLPAAALFVVVAGIVMARAATSPAPPVPRRATPSERAAAAAHIATSERDWLRQVGENFPQDNWSQRDDFHGREYNEVNKRARETGACVEDILQSIDDDLHRQAAAGPKAPDPRAARAVPCKPRPFYD